MEDRLLKRGETSGRSDDNVETIRKRFETFSDKTLPVVHQYDSIKKLKKVSVILMLLLIGYVAVVVHVAIVCCYSCCCLLYHCLFIGHCRSMRVWMLTMFSSLFAKYFTRRESRQQKRKSSSHLVIDF